MHQVGPVFSHGAFLLSQGSPNTKENVMANEAPAFPQNANQAATLAAMVHPCSYCDAKPNEPCTYAKTDRYKGRIKPTAHAERLALGRETYQAWKTAMRWYTIEQRISHWVSVSLPSEAEIIAQAPAGWAHRA